MGLSSRTDQVSSHLKMLTSTSRLVLAISSTDTGFIMVDCKRTTGLPTTIVSPSQICRDHKFHGFASVGLLDSNNAWSTLFHEKSVPTPISALTLTFGEDFSIVILSSAPPPLALSCNLPKIASASAACMAKRNVFALLRDHFSNMLDGAALRSNDAPPIEWLATKGAGPTIDSKYVRMDLGGGLGR
jgi:hypothetical protein